MRTGGPAKSTGKSDLDRRYLAQFGGFLVMVVVLFLLVRTGRTAYQSWHRDGYRKVAVEVLGPLTSTARSAKLRVLSTGEDLFWHGSSFPELQVGGAVTQTDATPGRTFDAWYNPEARLRFGIVLADQRLLSPRLYPVLPDLGDVLVDAMVALVVLGVGVFLVTSPYRAARRGSRRRGKRRSSR